MLTLDQKGFPVMLSSMQVPTKSGNPFHNPSTGEFSYAPTGVIILKGNNLLKLLSAGSRKQLADRAKLSNANQLAARIIDGKLYIVLLRDGKRVHSFTILPRKQDTNQRVKVTPVINDSVVQAARNLGLSDEQIIKFIEDKSGIKFEENQRQEILDLVQQQRLDDIVAYLDYQLQAKVGQIKKSDSLMRIAVGRGFFRQTFSKLDEAQTKIILDRLQGLGWSEDELQASIVGKFPKRLKDVFEIELKKEEGKDKLESKRQARTGQEPRKEAGKKTRPEPS